MRVKNTKGISDIWAGQTITAGAEYDIDINELNIWRSNDKVIRDLSSGDLLIGNGVFYKSAGAQAVAYLLGVVQEVIVSHSPPFTDKVLPNGKKLYVRATGKTFSVTVGSQNLDFLIPFNEVKFNGIEITNGKVGEKVTLQVLDTPTGTLTTIPNYMLNQFGDKLNVPDGFYVRESQYDADLIKDLQIRIIYEAVEARNIHINYVIHELKV